MAIERHFAFQSQSIPRAQSTRQNTELFSCLRNFIPYALARSNIRRNVDLETIFRRITRAGNQRVRKSANGTVLEPVVLDLRKVHVCELLQCGFSLRPLDGDLRVVVADVIGMAAKTAHIL